MTKPRKILCYRAVPGVFCAACGKHLQFDRLHSHPVPTYAVAACASRGCVNWGVRLKIPFERILCEVMPSDVTPASELAGP